MIIKKYGYMIIFVLIFSCLFYKTSFAKVNESEAAISEEKEAEEIIHDLLSGKKTITDLFEEADLSTIKIEMVRKDTDNDIRQDPKDAIKDSIIDTLKSFWNLFKSCFPLVIIIIVLKCISIYINFKNRGD